MYFKIFGYGHEYKAVLEFIRWWIRKGDGEWEKDIKKEDNLRGFFSACDVDRTILFREDGKYKLIIKKDVIVSHKPRELKKGEMYLNKEQMSGFFRSAEMAETWISIARDYEPGEIDEKKAYELSSRSDNVGVGFLLETVDEHGWEMHIRLDVVRIP